MINSLPAATGRMVGFVRIDVDGVAYDLPIRALAFARDGGGGRAGGFFEDEQSMGILVDAAASQKEMGEAIEAAALEAARHLGRRRLH